MLLANDGMWLEGPSEEQSDSEKTNAAELKEAFDERRMQLCHHSENLLLIISHTFYSYLFHFLFLLITLCCRRITKVGYIRATSITDHHTPLLHERKLPKKVIDIIIKLLFSLHIDTILNLDK